MKRFFPKRYISLLEKYKGRATVLATALLVYVFIDVLFGALILEYLDPIGFSRDHPYVVLSCFFVIFVALKFFTRREKTPE